MGYCQGMNFIVANLVQIFTENTAFWVFTYLLETIMPLDYYTTVLTATADQQILKRLAKLKLPKLMNHLESINLDLSLFTIEWFMCLYSQSVSQEVPLAYLTFIMTHRVRTRNRCSESFGICCLSVATLSSSKLVSFSFSFWKRNF